MKQQCLSFQSIGYFGLGTGLLPALVAHRWGGGMVGSREGGGRRPGSGDRERKLNGGTDLPKHQVGDRTGTSTGGS